MILFKTLILLYINNILCISNELIILHTNDIHSHYDESNEYGMDCTASQIQSKHCYGGLARMNTMIQRTRMENTNKTVLLMDGGDQFQGTLYYNYYKGEATVKLMNLLKYDIMTIGNHEFDDGPNHLAKILKQLNFPVVCSNIVIDEGDLKDVIVPYYIIEELSLVIIGYISDTTDRISPVGENIHFLDAIEQVQNIIDKLKLKGIKRFIGLSHYGYEQDKILASKVKGLSLIVGGHSHTYLGNQTNGVISRGDYPTKIQNLDGQFTYIVQAYCWSRFLGKIELKFNTDNEYLNYITPELIDLNYDIPKEPIVQNVLQQLRKPFDELYNIKLTVAKKDFKLGYCQMQECAMGNLITDALLSSNSDADISLINSGGIRAYFSKGNVTKLNLITVLPFKNNVVKLNVKGKYIMDLISNAINKVHSVNLLPVTSFVQVAGMKLEFNKKRIQTIQIYDKKLQKYLPLDYNKYYTLISIDFIMDGGDNLIPYKLPYNSYNSISEVVEGYLKHKLTISPTLDNRIVNLGLKNKRTRQVYYK